MVEYVNYKVSGQEADDLETILDNLGFGYSHTKGNIEVTLWGTHQQIKEDISCINDCLDMCRLLNGTLEAEV